jgi:hypothetical protein
MIPIPDNISQGPCSEETRTGIGNRYFELFGEKLSPTASELELTEAMLLIAKANLKNGFYRNISPEDAARILRDH